MFCASNCGVLATIIPLEGIRAGCGAGKPAAIELNTPGEVCAWPNVFSALYAMLCFTGKLSQAYLLSGNGIQLTPSPPRITVLLSSRYARPTRGANPV